MSDKNENKKSIFRQSSLDSVSSPEHTGDYNRLPTPSNVLAVLSFVILAAGAAVWLFLGDR